MLLQSDFHIHAPIYRKREAGIDGPWPTAAQQQQAARAAGTRLLGIVDHCDTDPTHTFRCLEELAAEYHSDAFDRTDTWFGVEADLHDDGSDECGPEGRAKLGLHYVIGSVHLRGDRPATVQACIDMEFRCIRNALLHNRNIDVIGHPFGSERAYERDGSIPKWRFGLVPREYLQEIVRLAAENRVALEVNRCLFDDEDYVRFWQDIRDAGALFEIGSDAHTTAAMPVIRERTAWAETMGLNEENHWHPAEAVP